MTAMNSLVQIESGELQRFARIAAPLLQGSAVRGLGTRAARNRPGPGLEFLDLRDYQHGDDIRHVDWRQSARRQRTVVRRFRDEGSADWFICTDASQSVRLHNDKWQMHARLTSALAYALLHAGHRVALLMFNERVDAYLPLGRGAHQFSHLVALLLKQDEAVRGKSRERNNALRDPGTSNLGACRDYLTPNASAFVISDFLEPAGMQTDLRSVRGAVTAVSALQVLANDEVRVSARGSARLRDVETGQNRSTPITEELLAGAQRTLRTHQVRLQRDCAALGIRFATCTTAERWERVLLNLIDTSL